MGRLLSSHDFASSRRYCCDAGNNTMKTPCRNTSLRNRQIRTIQLPCYLRPLRIPRRRFRIKSRIPLGLKNAKHAFFVPSGSREIHWSASAMENPSSGSIQDPQLTAFGPFRFLCSFLMPMSSFIAVYSDMIANFLHSIIPMSPVVRAWIQTVLSFAGFIFPFLILPMLDWIFGRDKEDPPITARTDGGFRLVLYLYIPVHLALLFAMCTRASYLITKPIHYFGVLLSIGTCGGVGFTVAHELIHGSKKIEEWFVNLLLCLFLYMHYSLSHLAHHIKVGTTDDAGTGRLNESFYEFLPRAVFMSIRDGIWMEKLRLQSKNLTIFGPQSKLWLWIMCPLMMYSGVYLSFGGPALRMMFIQGLIAVIMLENVNYIEHYGLTRKTVNGKLEQVSAQHSWNADWFFTSSVLFQLQRHAHHHTNSSLPYQALKSIPDGPLMPMSYPGMMLTTFLPPLFFKIMNPVIEKQRDLSFA